VRRLLAATPGLGVAVGIRTREQQEKLHREKPALAAPAGKSLHEVGRAVDVSRIAMVRDDAVWRAHLGKFGLGYLKGPTKLEPWHIQLQGPSYITKPD